MDHDVRQRLLHAMGYSLLQRRTHAAAGERAERPAATALPRAGTEAAAAAPASPLWPALLKAAAASLEQAERLGWECTEQGPPFAFAGATLRINLSALRGDPGAKRALWKTLRPLRRQPIGAAR